MPNYAVQAEILPRDPDRNETGRFCRARERAAQFANRKKGAVHADDCLRFHFTNVPINDCTLAGASKAAEHAAVMGTSVTSNRNNYTALVLI